MCSYEIFHLLFADFKDKFESADCVFMQKYVIGEQQITIYYVEENRIDVAKALDFLNELQKKHTYHKNWSSFSFKMFEAGNCICVFEFKSLNENEKRMYEEFCRLVLSELNKKKMAFEKEH